MTDGAERAVAGDGTVALALPGGAAGHWCVVRVRVAGGAAWWGKVTAEDTARGQVVREAFLGPMRQGRQGGGVRSLLMHVPAASTGLVLQVFTLEAGGGVRAAVRVRVLGRTQAALQLLAGGWRKLPGCLAGDRAGLVGRLRVELGQAPARQGEAPPDDVWARLYDGWDAARAALAAATVGAPPFDVVVFGRTGATAAAVVDEGAAAAVTRAAIDAQVLAPARVRRWGDGAPGLPGAWLVVVQAGEMLAPHALACFARAILRDPGARVVVADLDSDAGGILFKPSADPWLLASGLLTRGACAFHPSAVLPAPGGDWDADGVRLALASGVASGRIVRIPFVLTHVPDGRASRRPVLERPVLERPVLERPVLERPVLERPVLERPVLERPVLERPVLERPVLERPMLERPMLGRPVLEPVAGAAPSVSLIVPSSCRSAHVVRCLRDVLARTDYPAFEIVLAVSRIDPHDAVQRGVLMQVRGLPHVRVVDLQQPAFNFAVVNNLAVQGTSSDLVLLLNDDVSPISPGWLREMVALTCGAGAQADIVGARLLYGNDRVQHGGVIMGLANLCEHAFRLAARDDGGPYGLALLDRAVSAVTAACMLVRRCVWDALGGMDPGFAIALNDVDFCLRARALRYDIVLAAGVALHHFESLSLGRHYEGGRSGLEAVEVRRLRDRWQSVIADDPFYNPRASFAPGREFRPAFPPRLTPLAWIGGEDAAQH